MKMVQWIGFTFAILGVMLALVACSGATPLAAPIGAASGLNTFIYVYSEN